MKADLANVTFDPAKQFVRVVMQQGRLQLEADWNEQVAILVQGMRTLAADLIGPWGGSPGAFSVTPDAAKPGDFSLGPGHYYVDGIRCVNEPPAGVTFTYLDQPYSPFADARPLPDTDGVPVGGAVHYLVYLDVWERLITAAEDEAIREVALGGPDTAARTQVVWQVRVGQFELARLQDLTCQNASEPQWWPTLRNELLSPRRGLLRARASIPQEDQDRPCAIDPRASYRGEENALIRVEVHKPGKASTAGKAGTATFKWSFDNGAVVFPVDPESSSGYVLKLTTLGRDARLTLAPGDWVEPEDDSTVLQGLANPLFQVTEADYTDLIVTLKSPIYPPPPLPTGEHLRLRRWDQKGTKSAPLRDDGTANLVEAPEGGKWLSLGQGVQIQFARPTSGKTDNEYRTGDYWLIPARTAIGDVIWPQETRPDGTSGPAARPPAGVEHHHAPLAWITVEQSGAVDVEQSLVRTILPLATCPVLH